LKSRTFPVNFCLGLKEIAAAAMNSSQLDLGGNDMACHLLVFITTSTVDSSTAANWYATQQIQ
jgi:hypothetical protein